MSFIKRNINLIGKILFVLLILSMYFYSSIDDNKLEKEKMYSIAVIQKVRVNANIGESVYYVYFVNDSVYYSEDKFYVDVYNFTLQNIIGAKILVKFQESDPQNSKLLPNIRIADSVKTPNSGWSTIPVEEDKRCILE